MTDTQTTQADLEQDVLLSRREVAKLARVHPNTVKNVWEKNGWLTRIEVQAGRQMEVRYKRSEVDALIAERVLQRGGVADDGSSAARIAALEAENAMMKEELERLRKQHDDLLREIIKRAR